MNKNLKWAPRGGLTHGEGELYGKYIYKLCVLPFLDTEITNKKLWFKTQNICPSARRDEGTSSSAKLLFVLISGKQPPVQCSTPGRCLLCFHSGTLCPVRREGVCSRAYPVSGLMFCLNFSHTPRSHIAVNIESAPAGSSVCTMQEKWTSLTRGRGGRVGRYVCTVAPCGGTFVLKAFQVCWEVQLLFHWVL